jgi:hypothetical protein
LERSCCARGEKEKNLLFAGWHIAYSRAALAAMLIIILFLYKAVKENVFVGRLFFDAFSFQRNLRAAHACVLVIAQKLQFWLAVKAR